MMAARRQKQLASLQPELGCGLAPKVGTFADVVLADAIIKNISGRTVLPHDLPS